MDNRVKVKIQTGPRLRILGIGTALLISFAITLVLCIITFVTMLIRLGFAETFTEYWLVPVLMTVGLNLIFWTGIIMVYLTSTQLGITMRVIGILVGWIPIAHLVALFFIIRISLREYLFETRKLKLDEARKDQQVCKTKYPLFMVHGVFFRDYKHFNYWGRIPPELIKNGATIFYGDHESAETVEISAKKLAARIREVVETTGCGKVNVIAHSKGGLDMKYALATEDIAPYIASVTTINSPHHGCEFAEYILDKANEKLKDTVAAGYNRALRALGDKNPDFIAAVTDLTASRCEEISKVTDKFDPSEYGIFTQSFGSMMRRSLSGAFPMNLSYRFVKRFDGPNDGLVGEPSFHWGSRYTFIEHKGFRGVSHGDMIDLNRDNIPDFDVREFYVRLVSDLKDRGL